MSKNKTRPWFNWKQVLRLPAAGLYLCGRRPQAALRSLFSQSGVLTGDRVITRIFTATKHSGLQGTLSRARPWASRTHTPLPRPLDAHACLRLYNSIQQTFPAHFCKGFVVFTMYCSFPYVFSKVTVHSLFTSLFTGKMFWTTELYFESDYFRANN